MNKVISTFLVMSLFFGNAHFLFAETGCKYESEITQCWDANKGQGNPRDFDPETEFLCISSLDREEIIYNLILDKHFQPIDEKADKYLEALEKNKDYYFGYNRQEPYLKGIDDIQKKFSINGIFYEEYYKVCSGEKRDGILNEAVSCLGGKTSIKNAEGFMNESLCMRFAVMKNDIRKSVAYDILKLNKQAVRKDEKKLYEQKQRSNYELVVDLFMVNLGYILRIIKKWASKTKNPY